MTSACTTRRRAGRAAPASARRARRRRPRRHLRLVCAAARPGRPLPHLFPGEPRPRPDRQPRRPALLRADDRGHRRLHRAVGPGSRPPRRVQRRRDHRPRPRHDPARRCCAPWSASAPTTASTTICGRGWRSSTPASLERESPEFAAELARRHDAHHHPGYWRELVRQVRDNVETELTWTEDDLRRIPVADAVDHGRGRLRAQPGADAGDAPEHPELGDADPQPRGAGRPGQPPRAVHPRRRGGTGHPRFPGSACGTSGTRRRLIRPISPRVAQKAARLARP